MEKGVKKKQGVNAGKNNIAKFTTLSKKPPMIVEMENLGKNKKVIES